MNYNQAMSWLQSEDRRMEEEDRLMGRDAARCAELREYAHSMAMAKAIQPQAVNPQSIGVRF